MAKPRKTVTAPRLVALYGGVASTLRQALQEKGMMVAAVNERVGLKRGATTLYPYLRAEAAPPPELRVKLAKLLDIPESALMAAGSQSPEQALVVAPRKTKSVSPVPPTITVMAGQQQQVRLVLDQIMPARQAAAILMLLDNG